MDTMIQAKELFAHNERQNCLLSPAQMLNRSETDTMEQILPTGSSSVMQLYGSQPSKASKIKSRNFSAQSNKIRNSLMLKRKYHSNMLEDHKPILKSWVGSNRPYHLKTRYRITNHINKRPKATLVQLHIKRKTSITSSMVPLKYRQPKINQLRKSCGHHHMRPYPNNIEWQFYPYTTVPVTRNYFTQLKRIQSPAVTRYNIQRYPFIKTTMSSTIKYLKYEHFIFKKIQNFVYCCDNPRMHIHKMNVREKIMEQTSPHRLLRLLTDVPKNHQRFMNLIGTERYRKRFTEQLKSHLSLSFRDDVTVTMAQKPISLNTMTMARKPKYFRRSIIYRPGMSLIKELERRRQRISSKSPETYYHYRRSLLGKWKSTENPRNCKTSKVNTSTRDKTIIRFSMYPEQRTLMPNIWALVDTQLKSIALNRIFAPLDLEQFL